MDAMTRTPLSLRAALATALATALTLGCAATGPGGGHPFPETPVDIVAAPVLEAPSTPPSLLDQGDPASLRTSVASSLDYLAGLPGDSLLDFGVRAVPAGRLHAGLTALHDFLATDPDPAALTDWIRARFDVVESVGNADGEVLFTGYYEPVVPGCRERTERCAIPVYGPPADLVRIPLRAFDPDLPDRRLTGRVTDAGTMVPYYTRREIREEEALAGRGLEIAWVEDRVDLFFVEVQGSGAIRFPDGGELGIGVGASNGRPYRSIGRFLIDEGLVPAEEMSMQAIRRYLAAHPEDVPRVLNHNESFIFFRTRDTPPIGSLGQPVTPVRSIATDYRIFPRGALAFIDTRRPAVDSAGRVVDGEPLRRFMLNQDTGGAIRGPGRVDIFWGRGEDAAETAGRMQQTGRLFFLVPRADAFDAPA
jgi:membrane-bound lytic murein transglycosylase A